MSKMMLAQLFNPATGKNLPISTADVFDVNRKQTLGTICDEIFTKLEGLSAAEVAGLQTELSELKATFQAFMTGEDDDNGTLDRLKELVSAINANRGTIDQLLTDKASKAAVDALIEKVETLEAAKDYTGIAYVTSDDSEAVFNGKLKIVLQEIDLGEEAPGA